jgi:signal transduction histidine kinase
MLDEAQVRAQAKVDAKIRPARQTARHTARRVDKRAAKRGRKDRRDPRITVSRFSWREFLVMLFVVLTLSTGVILILSEYMPGFSFDIYATLAAIGYSVLMTFVVLLLVNLFRRYVYEKPIRQLGDAARQVAQGDFSVRLPVLRKNEKKDYMDVMYEDFNTMVEELGSIETLKDDFVGNVSHEIKTPLATITNYAGALSRGNLTAGEHLEYTTAIAEASKRLSALVSNILRLNKLENQGIVSDAEAYDLSEQLRCSVLNFESLLEEKDLQVEVDVDDQCIIKQDATLLEPVWNNLISNAIKFTPQGGSIRIAQRADAESIRVEITDSGCGMDDATKKRIFDKFYQGDTSHAQEGNGLGLALVDRALKLIDGEINVTSAPGEGSTFIVWLRDA